MEEKEKPKKKKPILLILIIILILAAFIGGIYIGNENILKLRKEETKETSKEKKEEKKEEQKKEEKEEEQQSEPKEEKKEEPVVKQPVTKEPAKEETLTGIDDKDLVYIKSLINLDTTEGMFSYHSLEELPKGKVENFSKSDKQYIIYWAARSYGLLDSVAGEKEGDFCYAGSGVCPVIKKENYNKLAKKYNIKETFEELYSDYHIENETAYYTYGGWVQENLFILTDNKIAKEGNNIVLTAYVNVCDDEYKILKKAVIKYTFNKLDNGYYALYSIDY